MRLLQYPLISSSIDELPAASIWHVVGLTANDYEAMMYTICRAGKPYEYLRIRVTREMLDQQILVGSTFQVALR